MAKNPISDEWRAIREAAEAVVWAINHYEEVGPNPEGLREIINEMDVNDEIRALAALICEPVK